MFSRSERIVSKQASEIKQKVLSKLGLISEELTKVDDVYVTRNNVKIAAIFSERSVRGNHNVYRFVFHERVFRNRQTTAFLMLICGREDCVFIIPGETLRQLLPSRGWILNKEREAVVEELQDSYHISVDGISIRNPAEYFNSFYMIRTATLGPEPKLTLDSQTPVNDSQPDVEGSSILTVTGDSWLDGIIWGGGSSPQDHLVKLTLNDAPVSMIEEVARGFQSAGLTVQYVKSDDEISGTPERHLILGGVNGFDTSLLTERPRKVDSTYPADFIDGYLITRLYTVLRRADGAATTKDILSRLGLRVRCNDGELDSLVKAMSARGLRCEVVHDGSIEIPAEYLDREPFSDFMQALRDEQETDESEDRPPKKAARGRKTASVEARDLRLIIPPAIITHLSAKAKFNSKLSGYDRQALFSIGRTMMFRKGITDKQIRLVNKVLERALRAGLQSDVCERGKSCKLCQELRTIVSTKLK